MDWTLIRERKGGNFYWRSGLEVDSGEKRRESRLEEEEEEWIEGGG